MINISIFCKKVKKKLLFVSVPPINNAQLERLIKNQIYENKNIETTSENGSQQIQILQFGI